ncbi:hypothetical protein evm_009320 [Chilo suppressalis]|nr:hypothetical protein evm_009320 [Chilo suppressalis]
MSYGHDEGPVYYREIQKNAYLKRIPNETSSSKLIPLGHKKPALKPMWTQFCVHNGRAPYLEQYPLAECPATLAHKPVWRACLKTARHVTASVKPHWGKEYDFLVDTDKGPVRMLAPDWDTMQDWVSTLRNKLHELRILSCGENVYAPPPAPPAPRAAARDPTSPLPPTPPVPPDRVPGIELTTPPSLTRQEPENAPETTSAPIQQPEQPVQRPDLPVTRPELPVLRPELPVQEEIDISNWEDATPSTSQDTTKEIRSKSIDSSRRVTKICGQNICLDDSILKRNVESTESDEEFFNEIDRISDDVENIDFDYKQTLVVTDTGSSNVDIREETSDSQPNNVNVNVTVIQVSNKGPPHTAIPVLGSETDIFDFSFANSDSGFVNIVNTEVDVTTDNGYGTVFTKDSDYGHLSLTTTVNVTADVTATAVKVTDVKASDNGVYERLCLASTSNETPVNRIKNADRPRKSSLPNLDSAESSTYECLFPNDSVSAVTVNSDRRNECVSNNSGDRNRSVTTVNANLNSNARVLRCNVERSHSQNAYDTSPRMREHLYRRVQNSCPKREGRNDKTESTQAKPIWKRGLTELSLLNRLRGIGQGKRHESPPRQETESNERVLNSSIKVNNRSRAEAITDNNNSRRRSSSLTNGRAGPGGGLIPLRRRQALALEADQQRRAAIPTTAPKHRPPLLAEYDNHICAITRMSDAIIVRVDDQTYWSRVDILFHRVPLGKIYVINKRDQESIGIKLDNECNIVSVERNSPAARCGLPPPPPPAGPGPGAWALTEVNNRPINLLKGGEDEMHRISLHGTEVSVLLQPSSLVKKLRAALKANKHLLSMR